MLIRSNMWVLGKTCVLAFIFTAISTKIGFLNVVAYVFLLIISLEPFIQVMPAFAALLSSVIC